MLEWGHFEASRRGYAESVGLDDDQTSACAAPSQSAGGCQTVSGEYRGSPCGYGGSPWVAHQRSSSRCQGRGLMYLDRLKQRVLAVIRGIQGLRTANRLKEKYCVIIGVEIVTKQTFALKASEVIWRTSGSAYVRQSNEGKDQPMCFSAFPFLQKRGGGFPQSSEYRIAVWTVAASGNEPQPLRRRVDLGSHLCAWNSLSIFQYKKHSSPSNCVGRKHLKRRSMGQVSLPDDPGDKARAQEVAMLTRGVT